MLPIGIVGLLDHRNFPFWKRLSEIFEPSYYLHHIESNLIQNYCGQNKGWKLLKHLENYSHPELPSIVHLFSSLYPHVMCDLSIKVKFLSICLSRDNITSWDLWNLYYPLEVSINIITLLSLSLSGDKFGRSSTFHCKCLYHLLVQNYPSQLVR